MSRFSWKPKATPAQIRYLKRIWTSASQNEEIQAAMQSKEAASAYLSQYERDMAALRDDASFDAPDVFGFHNVFSNDPH